MEGDTSVNQIDQSSEEEEVSWYEGESLRWSWTDKVELPTFEGQDPLE